MPRLDLGNPAPHELITADDGTTSWRAFDDAGSVTHVDIPDGYPALEVVASVVLPGGVWERHSSAPAPSWVACDIDLIAQLLADHYKCPVQAL